MKEKLKKQKKRLFMRVVLILFAVWISVSSAYCAILLYSEKNKVQNNELANLSYAKQRLSEITHYYYLNEYGYNSLIDLLYYNNSTERNWNSQVDIIDTKSQEVVVNTANKMIVNYGFKARADAPSSTYCFIDYNTVRNSLTDEQYDLIKKWLNTQRDDGKNYDVICTKFQIISEEIIPLELQITVTGSDSNWYIFDEVVETITLEKNTIQDAAVYVCNEMKRNIIPKEFFLNGVETNDFISMLTPEQRKSTVEMVPIGMFKYIFSTADYISYYDEDLNYLYEYDETESKISIIIQYAKKIDMLEICKMKIVVGVSLIFGFFLIIAIIMYFMIWKMITTQARQEQNRIDLTNALAHDIKTPLFVISGYAYSLKEDIDDNERDTYLEKIIEQTDKINNMVHKMLNLSKLNSYTMTLNRTDFDLYELIKEILDDYTMLPDGKVIVQKHSGESTINADKDLIRTALQNLIDNAVNYSLPKTEINIEVNNSDVKITNESEQLTKTDLKQIWQPYVRKDKSRHDKGNGLGLSIVKSIFDLHGVTYKAEMNNQTFICSFRF